MGCGASAAPATKQDGTEAPAKEPEPAPAKGPETTAQAKAAPAPAKEPEAPTPAEAPAKEEDKAKEPEAPAKDEPKADGPILGVVRLDLPAAHGHSRTTASFGYEMVHKEVTNLTLAVAEKGTLDEELGKTFDDVIKHLESQGCSAITGDHAFMMAFQQRARTQTTLPIFMSPMVQYQSIVAAFEEEEKIMVFSANGEGLKVLKARLDEHFGFDVENDRFVIVGLEDTGAMDPETGKMLPADQVQEIVVAKAKECMDANPTVRGILLEWIELVAYADALRFLTGLPVWDMITTADFYTSAYKDNPRFGVNDWQKKIANQQKNGKKEGDEYAAINVPTAEQVKIVSDSLADKQNPCLGVIRLDYRLDGAHVGDVENPASYGYKVIYRAVPGLTFEYAMKGDMEPEIEADFVKAIKFLESKGATCITGDCGFMMAYQKLARQAANVPVFMSSLVQAPMVSAAFGKEEKILILTANSESLLPQKEVLLSKCGFDVVDDHFVIEGCQDIPGFDAILEGRVSDAQLIQDGMVKKITNVLKEKPYIKCILCECHGLPLWADALRKSTGLPVFDFITCADFFVNAFKDNPRFGMNDWQTPWNGLVEKYKFGQNLSQEEKDKLVT